MEAACGGCPASVAFRHLCALAVFRFQAVVDRSALAVVAFLSSYFEPGKWGWDGRPSIDLDVKIPKYFKLSIDDGSGSIRIEDVRGDITVDDGSGSLTMIRVGGDIRIDDGSGSISVKEVGDSVSIVDGSGSITVRTVGGSVVIDDGSGGIDISDVEKDLIIEEDGSGSLKVARVQGLVERPN